MELRKRKRLDHENPIPKPHLESDTEEEIDIKQEKEEGNCITKKIEHTKHVERKVKKINNMQKKRTTEKNVAVKEKPKESKPDNIHQLEKRPKKNLEDESTPEPTKTVTRIKRLKTGNIPNTDLYLTTIEATISTDNLIPTPPTDSLLVDRKIISDNTQGLKHIINNVSLKRPALKTVESRQDKDNIETVPIHCLENYSKDLNRLIKLQQNLYYQDLKTPRLLGPRYFKHLKFPDDMLNLQKISCSLEELVSYRKIIDNEGEHTETHDCIDETSQYLSVSDQQKLVSIVKQKNLDKLNEEDITLLIANIHGIDSNLVRDLKCNNLYINDKIHFDPDYINVSELKSICRKVDKPLLRERNNNLSWPSRMRKKKHKSKNSDNSEENDTNTNPGIKENHPSFKFHNIPLFNSI